MSSEVKSFSKFRGYFFPIHRSEFSKFLPLFFLAFFVGFNYALLKTTKDSLVLVGSRAGAEVIPFLKVWGIVPGAVIVTMIYGWMSRRYSRSTVFCSIVGGFLGFFALFASVKTVCSNTALSVEISNKTSPKWISSPAFLSHLTRVPVSIVGESLGIFNKETTTLPHKFFNGIQDAVNIRKGRHL